MVYVEAINHACVRLKTIITRQSKDKFISDEQAIYASLFNIMRIGNWIRKMPREMRGDNPAIQWDQVAEKAHQFEFEPMKIDPEIIWDIVSNQVPLLHQQTNELMATQRVADNI